MTDYISVKKFDAQGENRQSREIKRRREATSGSVPGNRSFYKNTADYQRNVQPLTGAGVTEGDWGCTVSTT